MRGAPLVRLFLDCVANGGHTEIVRALLEAGADRTIKNNSGETALNWASNDATKKLLRDWTPPPRPHPKPAHKM